MKDHSSGLKRIHMKRADNVGDASVGNLTRREAMFAGAAFFALGSLGLTAGADAAAPATKPTGQAILGFSQEVTVLHPLMTANEVDQGVWWNLFSPLWMLDAKGKFVPLLAKAVPTVENGGISADGLTWRVELRRDVKWHDGKPMTSEDVRYSINLMKNPAFRARNRTAFELITSVGVEGDHVITWKLKAAVRAAGFRAEAGPSLSPRTFLRRTRTRTRSSSPPRPSARGRFASSAEGPATM